MAHTAEDMAKPKHSVFNVERNQVIGLIDEAWKMKGSPLANDPGAYIVNMGRQIGTAGETFIKIIVKPGTSEIITAYPILVP